MSGGWPLHAQNIAMMTGAVGPEIGVVGRRLVAEGRVRIDLAEAALQDIRESQDIRKG